MTASISNRAATWIAFGSIIKSSLVKQAPSDWKSTNVQSCFRGVPQQSTRHQCAHAKIYNCRNHRRFSTGPSRQQHSTANGSQDSGDDASKPGKRKASKRATNNSLPKVAVQAQRSRHGLIKGSGKFRRVDPDADTRDVTAYCAAETYDLERARQEVDREGYLPDPFNTGLFPQVLHAQTPNYVIKDEQTGEERAQGAGDVFIFPSGCVVTWNVPEKLGRNIVERVLPSAANGTSHIDRLEAEDLDYIEDPTNRESRIIGDTLILGTKPSEDHSETADTNTSTASESGTKNTDEIDKILAKIAFSSALARSTKLAVLENSLSEYFNTTRYIPSTLSSGKPLRYTRSQILRKTGELLSIRAQLNLYSELTDSLPDLFWDSPHELGLENYYDMVGRALDVGVRIRVLNEKMDYASEIAAVLRERLSEKHSTMLEWMIIGLICIEVGFGVVHLWRESRELEENERTRSLIDRYLGRELGRGD